MFPVLLFWILAVINAFNLVDVMDGLASMLAICVCIGLISFTYCSDLLGLPIFALLGGLVGFISYNRPSAVMYLGDAGAHFVGGVLAIMGLLFVQSPYLVSYRPSGCILGYLLDAIESLLHYPARDFLCFIALSLLFAIPLAEVMLLILVRRLKGIPFYLGSRDHFSHYLLSRGWSQRRIIALAALHALLLNVISLGMLFSVISVFQAALSVLLLFCIWLSTIFFPVPFGRWWQRLHPVAF